ncbi:hypothetical protein DACRYDRAFT_107371 [Dacryopinax primogenitus]|uniref:GPI transamidase component PIG-S n=1 Tax=Dacryopinax primogenitus (strain DJM 731) TaxID=1858805 RepID=M5G139_DACPD|nr:uncharacterized protein DACRYDRAFT_107371 [Dacryopinax primogenitus]EJU02454.1 hypothetical protein DACRYDRAFT_107371 [Dacryopinax primogenitus]
MAAVYTQKHEAQVKGGPEEGLSLSHPVHSDTTRRWIVASYWLVVLLCLPVWYYMTSIERLPLPTERIGLLEGKRVTFPIKIDLDLGNQFDSVQRGMYARGMEEDLSLLKQQSIDFPPLDFEFTFNADRHPVDPCLQSETDEAEDSYYVHFRMVDVDRPFVTCGRHLVVGVKDTLRIPLPVTDAIRDLVAPYSNQKLHPTAAESRIAQYSPTYRLAFTLLNEDASVGGAATGWEIHEALSRYIHPTLTQLRDLHNFTVESQVQYFGGLTFDPQLEVSDGVQRWTLSEEQMSVFINSAEWTLTSGVSNDPVLHFILFVPSAERRPLVTHTTFVGQRNDSFVLPQWGGVVIHNPPIAGQGSPNTFLSLHDLSGPFNTFRAQLAALLGVPHFTPQVTALDRAKFGITPWQLDALKRRRSLENIANSADALRSIVHLVNQIENMPVGQDVLGQVDGALAALDATTPATQEQSSRSLSHLLAHSIDALTLSSQAFFNPGMIGLLYYPTEHKYAVYTPLFAPVAVPLVVALVRDLRGWRARRRAASKQKTE